MNEFLLFSTLAFIVIKVRIIASLFWNPFFVNVCIESEAKQLIVVTTCTIFILSV